MAHLGRIRSAVTDEAAEVAIFNEAMSEGTRQSAPAVAAAYDFSRFNTLVDVGGGDGTLLAEVLATTPELRGVLFDLPTGLTEARGRLAAADVSHRCEIMEGDFFESVPPADGYVMKSVIHDWDDDRATVILKNCRRAIAGDGRLLVVEPVLPATVGPSPANMGTVLVGDLNMLVCTGGRERTKQEFAALLARAGFRLNAIISLPPPANSAVIEALPV